ncbi:MAG: uracil-DNA glycosylase [Inhella sp.]
MIEPGALAPGWAEVVEPWWHGAHALRARLSERESAGATLYPPDPWRALRLTPLDQVRVVILGQDPYHGPGQAEGLAFSVPKGIKPPPSLRNLLAEWSRDLSLPLPPSGHLGAWACHGVLLLNTVLTVEDGWPAAHARWGWESLTDALIRRASEHQAPKAFLLWGAHAQAKSALVDARRHLVLQANHPSPLAARRPPIPFLGCGHFGLAQAWLAEQGRVIDWRLPAQAPVL